MALLSAVVLNTFNFLPLRTLVVIILSLRGLHGFLLTFSFVSISVFTFGGQIIFAPTFTCVEPFFFALQRDASHFYSHGLLAS